MVFVKAAPNLITLPPCELSRLQEIEAALSSSFASPGQREKLASVIETQGFVVFLKLFCFVFFFFRLA